MLAVRPDFGQTAHAHIAPLQGFMSVKHTGAVAADAHIIFNASLVFDLVQMSGSGLSPSS